MYFGFSLFLPILTNIFSILSFDGIWSISLIYSKKDNESSCLKIEPLVTYFRAVFSDFLKIYGQWILLHFVTEFLNCLNTSSYIYIVKFPSWNLLLSRQLSRHKSYWIAIEIVYSLFWGSNNGIFDQHYWKKKTCICFEAINVTSTKRDKGNSLRLERSHDI